MNKLDKIESALDAFDRINKMKCRIEHATNGDGFYCMVHGVINENDLNIIKQALTEAKVLRELLDGVDKDALSKEISITQSAHDADNLIFKETHKAARTLLKILEER